MNRLEYNERIYNYKHGLVNSAGSQTIKHNSVKEEEKPTEPEVKEEPQEQEEEIEHSALGDEWDKHKYIRKIEKADGTVTYIYEDGSSRTEHNKPMATEGTGKSGGGTPGGSYGNTPKAPQTGTPGGVSGKSLSATALDQQRAVQTTPTGLYGNMPKSTPAEKVQDVKLGSKSTPTGLYSNQYKPNNEAYAEARLNGRTTPGGIPYGQTVKDAKISYVAKKDVTPGTLYGATGDRPIANHRIGQGTPGGVNGPALKANSYGAKTQQSAEIWNNLKNAVKDAPQQQPEQPKQEPVITNGTPGGVNGPSLTEGKEAQSFWNIMGNSVKGGANNYAQIGAEAPNNITDIDFENDSAEYRNLASYSVGYALGYLYGGSLAGKSISTIYPDYEGEISLEDPGFLSYVYNNDPAVKELADMVYNVAVNNYITANDMQKVYENKVSDSNHDTKKNFDDEYAQKWLDPKSRDYDTYMHLADPNSIRSSGVSPTIENLKGVDEFIRTDPSVSQFVTAIAEYADKGMLDFDYMKKNPFSSEFDIPAGADPYSDEYGKLRYYAEQMENAATNFVEEYGSEYGLNEYSVVRYYLLEGLLRPIIDDTLANKGIKI